MDPRSTRREPIRVPALRQVYDGGKPGSVDRLFVLQAGVVRIGRAVEGADDIKLLDPRVSRMHVELEIGVKGRVVLTNHSRHGTLVGGVRVERQELCDGDVLLVGESLFVFRRQPPFVPAAPRGDPLVGVSEALASLRAQVGLVGPTTATVLLLGETGVGKEVVARALHERSRRKGPFVAVNCGAIPEGLAESQLFGHRAGAFTSARADHEGFFQQARGGTLFLDELGELPPALQPKLLRVLDDKRVAPVGGREPVPVDVRVVAATNRALSGEVKAGRFRGDLYARVAEIPIDIPPLRDRREDVLALLRFALGDCAAEPSAELAHALLVYPWPFNVRELFKVATELKVRGQGAAQLELELVASRLVPPPAEALPAVVGGRAVDEGSVPEAGQIPERDEVVKLLEAHKGVIADIARDTGRSRKQIYRWLERYGLDAASYRVEG